MGWLKKGLKGLNKAVNKVGSAASKVVSTASSVVSKVTSLPGINMIPGVGTLNSIANTAGNIAGGVGNIIASGQSPRGGSTPAMASPSLELAPKTASKLVSGSVSVGNTNATFSTGTPNQAQEVQKPKSWFEKNKIVVFVSGAIAVLVGLFVALRPKGRGSRRR